MGVQKEALALLGLEGLQEMTKAVILFGTWQKKASSLAAKLWAIERRLMLLKVMK